MLWNRGDADDIQIYISFNPNQADALHDVGLLDLENCTNDVHSWMNSHSLKLNSAKCEFLLLVRRLNYKLSNIALKSISFSDITINMSQTCRNLGVMLDCNMIMSRQLRNIGFMKKYLTRSATDELVHALISSWLAFGNALLLNLPQTRLSRLQKLQNAAAPPLKAI